MRPWFIYVLIDPRNQAVRYVGWAYNVEKRMRDHIAKARKEHNHKASWLVQLEKLGMRPAHRILEIGNGSWAETEKRWIAFYRSEGADLTNLTDGGEGIGGCKMSAEAKQKMRAAKLGRKLTPAQIEKCARANRGKKRSRASIQNMIAGRKAKGGWIVSEEVREKIRKTVTGFRHTEEAKAKIRAASLGRRHSAETKAKMSEAHRGKVLSTDHKLKLAEAKCGKEITEEHKQHIQAALIGRAQRCGSCGRIGHKRSTCHER